MSYLSVEEREAGLAWVKKNLARYLKTSAEKRADTLAKHLARKEKKG